MRNKLEAELSRHLRPVTAPEELWLRIQGGAIAEKPVRLRWPIWAVAAAAAAMLALCFSLRSATIPYLERMASRELASGAAAPDLRSDDPTRIRAWVKAHAGLDVPLPNEPAQGVQLIGVSLLQGEGPVACITYRVGGHEAKLLVTRGAARPQHHPTKLDSGVASWTQGKQLYALAWGGPQEGNAACVLCHLDGRIAIAPRS